MTAHRRQRKQTKRAGQERSQWISKTQTVIVQHRPGTTPKDIEQQLQGLVQKAKTLTAPIGRQCKNSFNNLKSNMVTPEPSSHTAGRLKHSNQEEAEKKLP